MFTYKPRTREEVLLVLSLLSVLSALGSPDGPEEMDDINEEQPWDEGSFIVFQRPDTLHAHEGEGILAECAIGAQWGN